MVDHDNLCDFYIRQVQLIKILNFNSIKGCFFSNLKEPFIQIISPI